MGFVVLVVLGTSLVGLFIYLSRSRSRVMGYHDMSTPNVNHATHGGGGDGGGGGGC